MKLIKYFTEFCIILIFFFVIKILGLNKSRIIISFIFKKIGPFFRPRKIIEDNIKKSLSISDEIQIKLIVHSMWEFYGKIFSEYMFLKKFRNSKEKYIEFEGKNILNNAKKSEQPCIFISGHFDNFELMAMEIEKSGIKLCALYRPLNNFFLDKIMVHLRKKYICKNQIKKGISGTRDAIKFINSGHSIAMMIDQRLSEGKSIKFFGENALTTTLPAQLSTKYNLKIIPVSIHRLSGSNFKLKIDEPFKFSENDSIEKITLVLNIWLEKEIKKYPSQWIWSHNRWK